MSEHRHVVDPADIEVLAPNFKRRLSGVTSTIIQLVPRMRAMGVWIAVVGPGLPDRLPHVRLRDLPKLWRRTGSGKPRVWHARRNVEMLAGWLMRDFLRMPLRLLFTSASQRHHTRWTKFLIRRMDRIVATSARTASYLDRQSTVVMHGIDTNRFAPPASKPEARARCGLDPQQRHVGCFGRIRHQKGTDVFVDAMIALLPKRPGWSAVVAGRATSEHRSFENDLVERVRNAGLAERILFVGEHNDIDNWYKALDLFVAPQRWEGFGLTPLEAMASGMPVVATDVGAFPELVVPGQTGSIVSAGDVDAMVAACEPYLDDDALREASSRAALAHARRNFPLEREAESLIAIYREMAQGDDIQARKSPGMEEQATDPSAGGRHQFHVGIDDGGL